MIQDSSLSSTQVNKRGGNRTHVPNQDSELQKLNIVHNCQRPSMRTQEQQIPALVVLLQESHPPKRVRPRAGRTPKISIQDDPHSKEHWTRNLRRRHGLQEFILKGRPLPMQLLSRVHIWPLPCPSADQYVLLTWALLRSDTCTFKVSLYNCRVSCLVFVLKKVCY